MIGPFSFVHENRTYTCQPERREGTGDEVWWWFTVTHDQNRYAPFPAGPRDRRAATQLRIVAYYANHMARRNQRDQDRHWPRRGTPPVAKKAAGSKGTGAPGA